MKKLLVVLVLVSLLLAGCGQMMARKMGGSTTENLPPNVKLVNVTWKENSLWILTRPMNERDVPETYYFRESAVYGILEGEVTIRESRTK